MASRWQTGDTVEIRVPKATRGRSVKLGSFIGSGATAEVFEATDDSNHPALATIALKIYKVAPPVDIEDFVERCRIKELDRIPPLLADDGNQNETAHSPVAAPVYVVHGGAGEIIGVGVLRVDSDRFVSLADFTRTPYVRDLSVTVYAALRLATTVRHVHDRGYIIGDFSDTNVLIDQAGHVSLIDCDPYGTVDPRRQAREATVNWRAPENAETREASQQSDLFILAVHCIKLLLGGAGPFDGVDPKNDTNSPQANIDSGRSWLWIEEMRTPGPQFEKSRGMNDLPEYLMEALQGLLAQDPKDRPPTASNLEVALSRCRRELEMKSCGHAAFRSAGCTDCRTKAVSATARLTIPPTTKSASGVHPGASAPLRHTPSPAGRSMSKPSPSGTPPRPAPSPVKKANANPKRPLSSSGWAWFVAAAVVLACALWFLL